MLSPADGWPPLLFAPAFAVGALLGGAVSRGGACAGFLVSLPIAWGAGWPGVAMLAALLGLGTAVTPRNGRGRDAVQAAANGGAAAAGGLALAFGWAPGAALLAGGLATALSDTVAGEVGRRLGSRPRMLLVGPRAAPGTDGAMSLPGTAAGLLAAPLVPLLGAWCGAPLDVAAIAAAAFCGHVFDSAVGWTLQPRLGSRGNDWTNALSTAFGGLLAAALVTGT